MRVTRLLALGLIVLFALSATLPVYAAKTTYKAGGQLTGYENTYSSSIVSGHWSVSVVGNEVEMKLFYVELNLDEVENSPVGTRDEFRYTLQSVGTPVIDANGVLTFNCVFEVRKLWTQMNGTKTWRVFTMDGAVTVSEDGLHIDLYYYTPIPQDFDILGVTNYIKK